MRLRDQKSITRKISILAVSILPLLAAPLQAQISDSLLIEYELLFGKEVAEAGISEGEVIEALWTNPRIRIDPYPRDLYLTSEALFADDYFRRGQSFYESALAEITELRKKLFILKSREDRIPSDLWWRMIDRRNAIGRLRRRVVNADSRGIIRLLRGVITSLDTIQNERVRNDSASVSLRRHALRMLASHLMILNEYDAALEVLLDYGRNYGAEQEWPFHRYLFICYRYRLNVERINTGKSDAELREIRKLKNHHLSRYAEIRYGMNSEEAKKTEEAIRLDELGSLRHNRDIEPEN
jgi:hypothetical protein